MNVRQLENKLWEAPDQLRVNAKLTAAEPALGLIFLRHADNRAWPVMEQSEQLLAVNERLASSCALLLPRQMPGTPDVISISRPEESTT